MLKTVLKQGDWLLRSDLDQAAMWSDVSSIPTMIEQFEAFPETLKDNHRSVVRRGVLFGFDVVVKRPIDKNRRIWARLSSLLVESEAVATIANLTKLESAGIPSVRPLFALERRRFGMVVDSWMCYQYREGVPCGPEGRAVVIDMLQRMHRAGFRHGDPSWNNFLIEDETELFTIDTKARPCRGEFDATTDFLLLKHANKLSNFDIGDIATVNQSSIGYWIAVWYMKVKTFRSFLKSKIKKNRPKNI